MMVMVDAISGSQFAYAIEGTLLSARITAEETASFFSKLHGRYEDAFRSSGTIDTQNAVAENTTTWGRTFCADSRSGHDISRPSPGYARMSLTISP